MIQYAKKRECSIDRFITVLSNRVNIEVVQVFFYDYKILNKYDKLISNEIYNLIVDEYMRLYKTNKNRKIEEKNNDIYNEIKSILLMQGKNNKKELNAIKIKYMKDIKDIYYEILEFVKSNDSVNIDSFILFRYKKFNDRLERIVDIIIKEYFAKEYTKTYLNLVTQYINNNKSVNDKLILKFRNNKEITIIDDNNINILNKYKQELEEELLDSTLEEKCMYIIYSELPICIDIINIEYCNNEFIILLQQLYKSNLHIKREEGE